MNPKPLNAQIAERISQIEAEHRVRVLLAVEAGSRATGLNAADSDYDVRFIYAHPLEHYLSIDLADKGDVIDYPISDELDLHGWDLRKALQLFGQSNPSLIEWFQSPIIYCERGCFSPEVRRLLPELFSPEKAIFHYRSMAKSNFDKFLEGKDEVSAKKYLYVVRSLLMILWIEKYQQPAPMAFYALFGLLESDVSLRQAIEALVVIKIQSTQERLVPRNSDIDTFIERQFSRLAQFKPQIPASVGRVDVLNQLYRRVLDENEPLK